MNNNSEANSIPADSPNPINEKTYPLQFNGNAREYFGIWIVNMLLSILTLGIYSAWAKVRSRKYLYGNTELAGRRFDYIARPVSILKGRLIAFTLLVLYLYGDAFWWALPLIIGLLIAITFPWILVRSSAFSAYNSTWSGIRFNFDEDLKKAYKVYLLALFVTVITLGIAYPFLHYSLAKFRITQHKFCGRSFQFSATAGEYFKLYIKSYLIMIASIILIVIVFFVSGAATTIGQIQSMQQAQLEQQEENQPETSNADTSDSNNPLEEVNWPVFIATIALAYFAVFALYGVIWAWLQVKLKNLTWSNIALHNECQFHCNIPVGRMVWISFSNSLVILFSLGLLYPWAHIRALRYTLEHVSAHSSADINAFVSAAEHDQAAIGEELGDAFDLDLDF